MRIYGGVVESILGDKDLNDVIKNDLRQSIGDNDGFIILLVDLVRSMTDNYHDNLLQGWTSEILQPVRVVPIESCDVEGY